MRAPTICCLAFGAGLFASGAQAETTLDVVYAFPNNYKKVQEEIASRFEMANPGIKIKYRNPATNYDTALAQVLRESIIGETPDVFFTGGNYLRVLADWRFAAFGALLIGMLLVRRQGLIDRALLRLSFLRPTAGAQR